MPPLIPIALFSLCLAACGSEPASVTAAPSTAAETTAGATGDIGKTGSTASFMAWRERLDALLTADMAAKATGRAVTDMRSVTYRPGLDLRHEWPGTRTRTYAGANLPVHDRITLGVPRGNVTPGFFRSRFEPVDAARQQRMQQEVDRRLEQRGMDESARAAGRELAASMSRRWPIEDISGLGDDAVWEQRDNGQTLHILLNGSAISLEVNVSDDPAENKAIAIPLAAALIEKL